ncbi:hypothetical protein [Olsenella sp. An290]|uniref:hypothetical protein n=1 Tax=Olsenella sp. An290 TaxID=1965625 RepID=UPI000B3A1091|nr:hypothetical protein [Olsenella sp. An290]OUO34783.1 hypothetical protein B5F84_05260 [Olsenella sp. An290]
MWRRSEVEQLTGLGRHTIQDLCNQNTSRDGLGFWEPAVMKPGYSRFDEGDLLAFYLVRQLTKVGFTPAEVGPVILSMTEKNDEFAGALRKRACALGTRRSVIDEQLAGLERLEEAAADSASDQRVYIVMERELAASAGRAVDAAARELRATDALRVKVEARLGEIARSLADAVRGEEARLSIGDVEADLTRLHDGERSDEQVLLARALMHFLSEAENGVPVELALGKGSFARLRQLAGTVTRETEQ